MAKLGVSLKEVTYLQAITDALALEMERDQNVILMGEDIGVYGGAFKVTKGLMKKFGSDRVMDTPLAETALMGVAIGAALMGMRPVVEVQYADFIHCGWDEIVNVAAKMHYRSGEAVPMVVRAPSGAGLRTGPFHSQSPETYFAHTPGLKVVVPATPYDAKGLLISAIRDDNPVIFFEHKFLYRRLKDKIPEDDYTVPIGKANVAKKGENLIRSREPQSLDKSELYRVTEAVTKMGLDYAVITSVTRDDLKDGGASVFSETIKLKSGVMVGFGENQQEIIDCLEDIRTRGTDILTIGQYLRPTSAHYEVKRFYRLQEFSFLKQLGLAMNFKAVESMPLVRSSYKAYESFAKVIQWQQESEQAS